jgi:hypothetical protein
MASASCLSRRRSVSRRSATDRLTDSTRASTLSARRGGCGGGGCCCGAALACGGALAPMEESEESSSVARRMRPASSHAVGSRVGCGRVGGGAGAEEEAVDAEEEDEEEEEEEDWSAECAVDVDERGRDAPHGVVLRGDGELQAACGAREWRRGVSSVGAAARADGLIVSGAAKHERGEVDGARDARGRASSRDVGRGGRGRGRAEGGRVGQTGPVGGGGREKRPRPPVAAA